MGEFANELLRSLNEALAHAKGERKVLVCHEVVISVEAEAATTDRLQDAPHSPEIRLTRRSILPTPSAAS